MHTIFRICASLCLVLATTVPSFAHDEPHSVRTGNITIERPWARATPVSAKVGAGYLKITNSGSAPDRLVSIKSSIAPMVQLHEMTMTDGVMKMRHLAEGVKIPAGGSVTLKPGGNHVMFKRLKAPIKKGDTFKAELTFEKAGNVEVEFMTVAIGAMPAH